MAGSVMGELKSVLVLAPTAVATGATNTAAVLDMGEFIEAELFVTCNITTVSSGTNPVITVSRSTAATGPFTSEATNTMPAIAGGHLRVHVKRDGQDERYVLITIAPNGSSTHNPVTAAAVVAVLGRGREAPGSTTDLVNSTNDAYSTI